ncbi:MAG: hypothetical protein HY664_00985, partial [Chloroflexi bacterium]|nr:hypothetical protein [Chloroflexota bacterium]
GSLVYPIFRRFDPNRAQLIYWLTADKAKVYSVLTALILGYSIFRGRKNVVQAVLVLLITFVTILIVMAIFSPHFERARPFTTGEVELPQVWQRHWPKITSFPELYLVGVMTLTTILARLWTKLSIPAYLYPFLVIAGLFYFGATWPTDAIATLVVGYLVGRYSLFLAQEIWPSSWKLGNDDPKGSGDNPAGNGGVADGLSIGVGGEG